jgi:hypothetical protein
VRENVKKPLAILVEYRDGTRGSVVNSDRTSLGLFVRGLPTRLAPPGRVEFLPTDSARRAVLRSAGVEYRTVLPLEPIALPVERTLLTSTVLDLALHALKDGKPSTSPALDIRYSAPADSGFFRGPVEG